MAVNMSYFYFKKEYISEEGTIDHIDIGDATTIYCGGFMSIKKLPNWPKVKKVYCYNNQITDLPVWPLVEEVYCENNQLTELPNWSKVRKIFCWNNRLIDLPNWTFVENVQCQ